MKSELDRLIVQADQLESKLSQIRDKIENLRNPTPVELTEEEIEEMLGYPVTIVKKS